MDTIDPRPVTLSDRFARLEPLEPRHAEGLLAVGRDESVFRYLMRGPLRDVSDAQQYVAWFLDRQREGNLLPFAIIELRSDCVAGMTTYLNISRPDCGLEIGHTWLGVDFQRTPINTECKFLLLRHAFEVIGCVRVQLKTDLLNERSQRAIERIGATREGVLRKFQRTQGGRIRDTVMYSVLESEWPAVRRNLERLQSAYDRPAT